MAGRVGSKGWGGNRSMIVIRGATRPEAQAAAVMSEVIRQGRSAVFHLRSGFGGGVMRASGFGAEKGLGSRRETEGVVVSTRWGGAAASLRGSSGSLLGGIGGGGFNEVEMVQLRGSLASLQLIQGVICSPLSPRHDALGSINTMTALPNFCRDHFLSGFIFTDHRVTDAGRGNRARGQFQPW